MIVRANVFIMPILHPKATGDCPELNKTKSFIQMSCVDITLYNRIELKHTKAEIFCVLQAIKHQFFTDVLPSA